MDLELKGKTAIVTGGSRGIGKAVARELATEGARVVIASRTRDALEAAARELSKETGATVLPIPVDTTDDASVKTMVQQARQALGHIDILVNSAAPAGGQGPAPRATEFKADQYREQMDVKVMGYLRCAQEVAPIMRAQGWGRIINIGGLAARSSGAPLTTLRNVSVAALTKDLADELGQYGINVTVVHPGATRTERTPALIAQMARSQGISEQDAERRMAEGNSIRHLVDAREIAYVVAFLASPRSIAINGDAIAAGGGAGRSIYY
jgi:NAD(P)-dependent dehydrogenase (short-subunit alcohol dehydrogenase family)